jgi:protocatechuate 3,4-dioxygenase beta subunit
MPNDPSHLITRRRSLALLGAAGAGVLLGDRFAGHGDAVARVTEGDDHVAAAARACTLTAEQEEGPFYVALERIRHDIVAGQAGLPMELEITLIDSATCKPLRHAAVDIWHCNALGVYSDISSENTFGQSYLRGVQFTDHHGQATFRTIFPGHYTGRTTHIHLRVHIGSARHGQRITGGHVSHTGQLFPPEAVYTEVYRRTPYSGETAAVVTHAADRVWTEQHGSEAQLKITRAGHRLARGLIARVTLGVNPRATPALIGPSSNNPV